MNKEMGATVGVAEGGSVRLGRFDHHPDPAIDFCIEVEEIQSIAWDRDHKIANPDDPGLHRRIEAAMRFRVGGDEGAVKAKWLLRQIEAAVMMAPDGAGHCTASITNPSQVPGSPA